MMLTSKKIDNAYAKRKLYRLFDGHGLYLEITPNGGKYWRFKYRFDKKERRIAFGTYPDVSLLEAREKREAARKQVLAGIDPTADRNDKRRAATLSIAELLEQPPLPSIPLGVRRN